MMQYVCVFYPKYYIIVTFCWNTPNNSGNSGQNTHKFAVIIWINDGGLNFFSKTGSFVWWSVRIF